MRNQSAAISTKQKLKNLLPMATFGQNTTLIAVIPAKAGIFKWRLVIRFPLTRE